MHYIALILAFHSLVSHMIYFSLILLTFPIQLRAFTFDLSKHFSLSYNCHMILSLDSYNSFHISIHLNIDSMTFIDIL